MVFSASSNTLSSTESGDLFEKLTNYYHTVHALSEPPASKLIRSCFEESEDICIQVMSSVAGNEEASSSESIVLIDHSYASW
ncbi:hypothetical protein Smp_103430 [Schistosoma mansoni]|uniref:GRAS domain-containing protein n=1 Tax=Schistosoma mansoni TaxID=6183 RepID=C4QPK0_SCHMA|nr:hypothetical protein Smp_103430 [Schistosoma mansoni]|eukprot:XP_018644473.1 hypothetical protein Smp_103430 [Schistosoma mansoni]